MHFQTLIFIEEYLKKCTGCCCWFKT